MGFKHKQSIKEVIKHILFKTGTGELLKIYRRNRGYVTDHLQGEGARERFSEIYKLGTWVHADGQESKSGLGSENAIVSKLTNEIPEVLEELGCKILLDVGCGDWNWMANIELQCDYIGVDIVPEVIESNKQYEKKGVHFILANASEDTLPKADVVLCREVLFHLSIKDSMAAIRNIRNSAKWLIATTDRSIWFNSDIQTGDFRNINVQYSPYKFPNPSKIILDNSLSSGRILGVWKTSNLPLY